MLSGRSFLRKSDSFTIPEIRHKGGNQACHHNHCEHNAKDQFLTGEKGCQDQDDACREEAFPAQAVSSAPVFFAAKSPWSPYAHEKIAFHFRQFISNKEEQNTDGDRNYSGIFAVARRELGTRGVGVLADWKGGIKNPEGRVKM